MAVTEETGPRGWPGLKGLRTSGWLLPALVMVLGVAASCAGAWRQNASAAKDAETSFQRMVLRSSAAISERFSRPLYGLNGARGVYATHAAVTRDAFRRYVASHNLPVEFPGVRGFGFIQPVQQAGPGAADRYTVQFIEPFEQNAAVLGLDLGSEPVRRQGVLLALETGEATTSGMVNLVHDQRGSRGVLMFLPVYGAPVGTDPMAPKPLRGLLYARLVVAELLADLGAVTQQRVRTEVFDTASGTAQGPLMFDSAPDAPSTTAPHFETMRVVDVPGRLLTVRVRSTPAFDAVRGPGEGWLLGVGGSLASLLLAALLRQQMTGRRRAEALAGQMTADLGRLALVAQRTSNAVIITDAALCITWVNEGFTRLYGYSAAQALGRKPGDLLGHPDTPPEALRTLRGAAAAGTGCRVQVINRTSDGRRLCIDTEVQAMRDPRGALTGFVEIASDVTELKRAETALRASQDFLVQTGRVGGVGGWELDIATQALSWSDETCRIHDVEPGHHPTLEEASAYYAPDAQRTHQQAVQAGMSSGRGWDLELPMVTARGRAIWVRTVGEVEFVNGTAVRLFGALQDITARRELEAALRAKNELVSSVIENLPCGLSVFDDKLHLLAANREFRRLLDFPDALFDAPTVQFEDLVRHNAQRGEYGPGDVEATVQAMVARAHTAQQLHQFERVRPDGTPLEVHGAPMPGGGFVTTYIDISARKSAEATVQRSAALLRGAIEAIDEAFVLFDPDDRLVLCNDKYRQIYAGMAHLMVPGATFEEIIRPGAEAGDYIEAIGRTEAWMTERVAAHRAGNSTLIQPLANGRTLRIVERKLPDGHIVGFRVDITEIVRATQEAERATLTANRARARLQAIYDILPVGVALTDKQGHIIDCNPASERLLGISKAEHLARDYDGLDWNILREDGTPMPAEEFASVRALTQQTVVHDAVMQVVTPHSSVWLSVSAMPVQHEELGVVIGYVDITEQRAQTAALLKAKLEAEQASVAKSQFLANMSHEIRTPMNAILGMLALLRKTELSTRQADYAGKTEGAARSLLGLLNDILDFSKVEAGKMTLDPHPFRFDQLMRDLGVILSANVGAKPLEVLFDVDPALPRHLVGDAMRLQQVLINLGGNAIKFTPSGEVVVSARVVQRSASDVTLRVAVRDTGIGIAPENQARIFSGFTQAEASTTRRYGGTGLGVVISQRLVALMGGELKLDSAPGVGTTFHFTLTLPVVADAEAAPADVLRAAPPGQTLRALVVDDNPTAREVLQHMTEALGWAADMADSGEAALALLAARAAAGERYDAVFVDWQMPGLDGWETAARIRAGGLAADAPLVVMVTAHGREKLEARSGTDKALLDGFLVKPVTASMLLDAVVDARQGRDQPHLSAVRRLPAPAGAPRLAGLRLLIAEDNLNNQQVARELLEGEGASVQIANNGLESVEAVAAADPPFDVVLMDLQMPVMDGFTATARIRQDLGKALLPIVAMTANAMASDRVACLAAGMNDHVGKPFDLDLLVALLLRVSGRGSPATPAAATPHAAAALPADLMQAALAAGVDLSAALKRLGGKQAVYTRMLRNSLPDFEAMPALLAQQLASGATQEAGRTLHTLKGVAATLGAAGLATQAGAAEKAMADQAPAEAAAPHGAAAAAVALQAALPALQALLACLLAAEAATPDAAAATPLNPAALHAALTELAGLLQDFDMRATEVVSQLRGQAGTALGPQLQALDDAVGALDFERAAPLCQELLAQTQT